MMRPWSPYHQRVTLLTDLTDHHMAGTERQLKPNTSPHPLTEEARRQHLWATHMTCNGTWPIKPVRLDQSMDQEVMPRLEITDMKPGVMNITIFGINTELRCHPISAVRLHDIEAPSTPCALSMR